MTKAVQYWQQADQAVEGKDLDYTMKPKTKVGAASAVGRVLLSLTEEWSSEQ